MTRQWGPSYSWVVRFLIQRDGEKCYLCGEKVCKRHGTHSALIVEHKDNDETNFNPANLGLAHRCCNGIKNPHGSSPGALPRQRERLRPGDAPTPTLTAELASQSEKSAIMRARWLDWIHNLRTGPFAQFEYLSVKSLTKWAPRALARTELGEESLGVPQSYEDYVEMDSVDFGGPLHIFTPKTGDLKGVLCVEYVRPSHDQAAAGSAIAEAQTSPTSQTGEKA